MIPFIKVCGIQNADEAHGALDAGATAIGLLVGLTHVAEDKITPENAREIVYALPRGTATVMVTHLLDEKEIADLADFTGVSVIQVHDALPVLGMKNLRHLCPDKTLIKAVHVMDETAFNDASVYESVSDMLLLDSRTKDRLGGTGLTHDWGISASIVRNVSIPVVLAGGLKPENVGIAIDKVRPAGIDANSGLENPDGSKDFEKIRLFARAGAGLSFR